jgi:hypothetical protein
MVNGTADGANAIAFHEDLSGLQETAGVYLKKAGGVEDDGSGRSRCRLRPRMAGGKKRHCGKSQHKETGLHATGGTRYRHG